MPDIMDDRLEVFDTEKGIEHALLGVERTAPGTHRAIMAELVAARRIQATWARMRWISRAR
jgi:hypothetical protein